MTPSPVPPVPNYARPGPTPVPPHAAPPPSVEPKEPLSASGKKWKVIGLFLAAILVILSVFLWGAYIGHRTPSKAETPDTEKPKKKNARTVTSVLQKSLKKILSSEDRYVVVLGAFKDAANAKELIKILEKENVQTKIVQKNQSGSQPVFVVRTDAYPSYAAAEAVTRMLAKSGSLSATAVKLQEQEGKV